MSEIKVLRHEKKFYISYTEYTVLRSILRSTMTSDPNSGPKGDYFVRSIYFDSINNDNYYDKILGIKNRKKLRIRTYNTEASSFKLEIKEKDGDLLLKDTLIITESHYKALIKGNYDFLLALESPCAKSFHAYLKSQYLRPVITVDYEREAYIHPFSNLRVNFDKNIRVNRHNYNIHDKDMTMEPLSVEPVYVLEVKYNDFMPDWFHSLLTSVTTTQSSYSKYCIGRYI